MSAKELEETRRRWLRAQRIGELADGGDEDQVEEELEPRRTSVVLLVAGERPQARRLEKARKRAHLLAAEFRLALLDEGCESLVCVL